MEGIRRSLLSRRARWSRPLIVLFALMLAVVGLTACESKQAKELKAKKSALDAPLSALAEQGDLAAMQLVADIEVLRAQTMFPDSVANALVAMPCTAFLHLDEKGELGRYERGDEITALLEFSTGEAQLVRDGVITAADGVEVRRLAGENLSAAADKVKELKSKTGSGLP
jgi:hypothetical protein